MHSLNIMHHDLKLENILFKENGSITCLRIVDFVQLQIQMYVVVKCSFDNGKIQTKNYGILLKPLQHLFFT